MKILVVAWHLTKTDGWGTSARNVCTGLKEKGHDVTVLTEEIDETVDIDQRAVLPNPLITLRRPWHWFRIASLLKKYDAKLQPDIIHFMAEPYLIGLPFVRRPLRGKTIVTACGTWTVLPLTYRSIRSLFLSAYQKLDWFLAISSYTKTALLDAVSSASRRVGESVSQKISVFSLSIDTPEKLAPAVHRERKNILFAGEVKDRKGVLEIVRACKSLRDRNGTDFQFDIVGNCSSASYREKIEQYSREHALTKQITIHGHVKREVLEQKFREADLFCMLSKSDGVHFEGYGLVFLEANALGIPVIGPNGCGCIDAIEEGISGYTVDPSDTEAVCDRMEWILRDNRIDREKAFAWAQNHSHISTAEQVESLYEKLLSTER